MAGRRRPTAMTRTRVGLLQAGLLVALALFLVAAFAAVWVTSSGWEQVEDGAVGLDPVGVAKLDPKSRVLVGLLDAGESVGGSFVTRDPSLILDLGRSLGLDARDGVEVEQPQLGPGEQAQVYIFGPSHPITRLAAHPAVVSTTLSEDFRALRPVASPRPAGDTIPILIPGRPYLVVPVPMDPMSPEIPADRRAPILASLGQLVETIDGRPYTNVSIGSDCDDVAQISCTINLEGLAPGSVDQWDWWSGAATKAAGWSVALEPGQPNLAGVPRWLAREAERIARNDPATAAEIGQYEEIRDFVWDRAAPGVIRIRYWRICQFGSQPQIASLADHGVPCLDYLDVTVDVPAGRVISRETIVERT
jgi:hypothetical protein